MIENLIEFAHDRSLVRSTTLEPDGCDAYRLRALPRPITVWVHPDGRFSRAMAGGELLTLGQVMRGLLAVVKDQDVLADHTEASHAAGMRPTGATRVGTTSW